MKTEKFICDNCGSDIGLLNNSDNLFELNFIEGDCEQGDLIETFISDEEDIFTCTNNKCAKEFNGKELYGLEKRELTE